MRRSARQPLAFARSPRDRARPRMVARAGRLLFLAFWLALAVAVAVVLVWSGRGRPRAELLTPLEVVGRKTPVTIALHAGRPGVRSYEVRLDTADGPHRVASDEVPRPGWLGSGIRESQLQVTIEPAAIGVGEGDARLVVLADENSPVGWMRGRGEVLSVPVSIDLTPPKVTLLSGQQRIALGGSAIAVYDASPDTARSGVEVGPAFFPGRTGDAPSASVYVALFAVPHDADARVVPKVVAEDRAGNRREVPVPSIIKPKRFPTEEIVLTDDFLRVKVPDLISQNGLVAPADPVEGYLLVNRELRRSTEERVREICRESAPRPLFDGAFLQQPGTAVGSRFAERRTYRYNGRVIDEQTHLGTDLASVKQDPVVAANSGTVLFTGNLGIYGNAIVVDHGLGLESLYAHLSQIGVAPGQAVARGDTIGRTGDTGLAGGDHLHFSVLVDGVHVDPVEWWDGKWIRDHVAPELAVAAAAGAKAAPAASAAAPGAPAAAAPAAAAPAAADAAAAGGAAPGARPAATPGPSASGAGAAP